MHSRTIQADHLAKHRLPVLYTLDNHGGLVGANEPWGPGQAAPLAHVCFVHEAVVFGLRAGLPDDISSRLTDILAQLRPVRDLTAVVAGDPMWEPVRTVPWVTAISCGPAYTFPEGFDYPTEAVLINAGNSGLTQEKDPRLAQILPYVSPCYAKVVDGRAVSICHTVRIHDCYREAGVDTWPAYRRRGYGTEVVAAWARDLIATGSAPLYSTDWDNRGSLAVAARLGLDLSAADVEIE